MSKWIFIDGLFEKQGTNSALWRMMNRLDLASGAFYCTHDFDIAKIPLEDGDNVCGFSLGGKTACDLIDSRPTTLVHHLIGIEPVFGFNWFGAKRIIPYRVMQFLQIKATWTLPWAIWSFYKREDGGLGPNDKFTRVSSGHGNCPDKCDAVIDSFLLKCRSFLS